MLSKDLQVLTQSIVDLEGWQFSADVLAMRQHGVTAALEVAARLISPRNSLYGAITADLLELAQQTRPYTLIEHSITLPCGVVVDLDLKPLWRIAAKKAGENRPRATIALRAG
jgi:hypothetical protein